MPTSLAIPLKSTRPPANLDFAFWLLIALPIVGLAAAIASSAGATAALAVASTGI